MNTEINLSPSAEMLEIEARRRELRKRRDAVMVERNRLWDAIHSGHAHTESQAAARARELLGGAATKIKTPGERLAELDAEARAFGVAARLLADEARRAGMAALRQHVATLLPQYREHARDLSRALRMVAAANDAIERIRDALWQFAGTLPTVGGLPYAAYRGKDGEPILLGVPDSALARWFANAYREGLLDMDDLPPEAQSLIEPPRGSPAPAEAKRASARRFY